MHKDGVRIDVPYEEKDAAKALGARWDPALRTCYVPQGRNMVPFCRWLPAHLNESCPATTYLPAISAGLANVRIYLGRGAGAEIMRMIAISERSIVVVSPYPTPYLVSTSSTATSKGSASPWSRPKSRPGTPTSPAGWSTRNGS